MIHIELSEIKFNRHLKHYDGLCKFCGEISIYEAEEDDVNQFCRKCQNRGLYGMKAALKAGLITIHPVES